MAMLLGYVKRVCIINALIVFVDCICSGRKFLLFDLDVTLLSHKFDFIQKKFYDVFVAFSKLVLLK